jgi:hypothetical protein
MQVNRAKSKWVILLNTHGPIRGANLIKFEFEANGFQMDTTYNDSVNAELPVTRDPG